MCLSYWRMYLSYRHMRLQVENYGKSQILPLNLLKLTINGVSDQWTKLRHGKLTPKKRSFHCMINELSFIRWFELKIIEYKVWYSDYFQSNALEFFVDHFLKHKKTQFWIISITNFMDHFLSRSGERKRQQKKLSNTKEKS